MWTRRLVIQLCSECSTRGLDIVKGVEIVIGIVILSVFSSVYAFLLEPSLNSQSEGKGRRDKRERERERMRN